MCILLATREHPDYDLILVSNRDEFFERRTSSVCWHNNNTILSPYDMTNGLTDLENSIYSTWIGMNRSGKICSVLNLKLLDDNLSKSKNSFKTTSRGLLPFTFLSNDKIDLDNYDSFEKMDTIYPYLTKSGDFNFFYGDIRKQKYVIIDALGNTFTVLNEKDGLNTVVSNDIYRNYKDNDINEWGKIKLGKLKILELLENTKGMKEKEMIDYCLKLGSICIIDPTFDDLSKNPLLMAKTIFVPPLTCLPQQDVGLTMTGGMYFGTRSQMVILVDKDRKNVTVCERILHSSDKDTKIFDPQHPKEMKLFKFTI